MFIVDHTVALEKREDNVALGKEEGKATGGTEGRH